MDGVFYLHNLRNDRHRNFSGGFGADAQAYRAMQTGQFGICQFKMLFEAGFAGFGIALGAQSAYVESVRTQGLQQGHVVQLGVVREGHNRGVGIGL